MNNLNSTSPNQSSSLAELLAAQSVGHQRRRWLWLGLIFLIIVGSALWLLRGEDKQDSPRYLSEEAAIGRLVVTVSATGRLQPTNQVAVGSELSGIVEQVFVDVNDAVTKGQMLARLDLAKLQDAVTRSRANLAAARAQVLQSQATVAENRATLSRFEHVAQLSAGKVPARSELDSAEANLKRAEAAEASAHAAVAQAEANLQSDETNLGKATIRSPIDGVVLAREIDPGQTVAASFQAPVLFTLAEDLTKMELQVDVDEADVGQVQKGQSALFSVDAWPGRRYTATITRVGYGAQEKDGVISYLTVLAVANEDLSLRPGMTGTAEITTQVRENVLLVPNAALRFAPALVATPRRKSGGVISALLPRPPGQMARPRAGDDQALAQVWVLKEGQPQPLAVETGASNGRMTEVVGGDLQPGMAVITEAAGGSS